MLAGQQPAMAGDQIAIGVDQNRAIEPEARDALGDLTDLLFAVDPCVLWIGFDLVEGQIGNGEGVSRWPRKWLGIEIDIDIRAPLKRAETARLFRRPRELLWEARKLPDDSHGEFRVKGVAFSGA